MAASTTNESTLVSVVTSSNAIVARVPSLSADKAARLLSGILNARSFTARLHIFMHIFWSHGFHHCSFICSYVLHGVDAKNYI